MSVIVPAVVVHVVRRVVSTIVPAVVVHVVRRVVSTIVPAVVMHVVRRVCPIVHGAIIPGTARIVPPVSDEMPRHHSMRRAVPQILRSRKTHHQPHYIVPNQTTPNAIPGGSLGSSQPERVRRRSVHATKMQLMVGWDADISIGRPWLVLMQTLGIFEEPKVRRRQRPRGHPQMHRG